MDPNKIREARNASRTEYLKTQTELRNKAAHRVIESKLQDIESGIIPTSATEAQYILERAKEIQTADGLHRAAKRRQELVEEEGVSVNDAYEQQGYLLPDTKIQGDGKVTQDGFIHLDKEKVQARIQQEDYVAEKTAADIQREKADLLQHYQSQIQEQRKSLPIFRQREALLEVITNHQVVVIVGEDWVW
ncbi:hypothetical protein AGDE_04300 [Angomonas deanei]|uniref:Uncharacterized protein n=1 Tax=Angomonas deanei TaxID=59799 RepID=A0A7G2C852_9TRYP|nr:hypothetical protein AGDE_04300 [Angomonas deanei]CAD2214172.1 hypothetical protein, conserved [Angomonas deanei]|eukprot:EPY39628.1 hypothetical protein AGDE_04300 [Angomonas deanei]